MANNDFVIILMNDYYLNTPRPDPVLMTFIQLTDGAPAVQQVTWTALPIPDQVTQVTWNIPGTLPMAGPVTFVPGNAAQAQIDFQNMLNTFYPGFTVQIQQVGPGGTWQVDVSSKIPGDIYNGITPTVQFVPPNVILPNITAFVNGTGETVVNLANADQMTQTQARSRLNLFMTEARSIKVIRPNRNSFPQPLMVRMSHFNEVAF